MDFAIAFVLVLGMMVWYHAVPTWAILTLPFFVLFAIVDGAGGGPVALRAERAVSRRALHAAVHGAVLAVSRRRSPIRPGCSRRDGARFYGLNPMAGVIEGFRWALLGKTPAPGAMLWVSVAVVAVVLVGGLFYFRRMEKTFADVV